MGVKLDMIFFHVYEHFISGQHGATVVTLNHIFSFFETKVNEPFFNFLVLHFHLNFGGCGRCGTHSDFGHIFTLLKNSSGLKQMKNYVKMMPDTTAPRFEICYCFLNGTIYM